MSNITDEAGHAQDAQNADDSEYAECAEYAGRIKAGCAALRRGDDHDALYALQHACLLWLDAFERQADDPQPSDLACGEWAEQLEEALRLLEAGDIARAADRLEFGLVPMLVRGQTGGGA